MIHLRFSILLVVLIYASGLKAQRFSYVHYDEKDGLAGSTVYDMCQDKDGYMWFATESGLSRFDGTHFRSYTTRDGLVDNEVLKVFADSRGRVWIGSLNKALCYYYKGKIFNDKNDEQLKKVSLTNFPGRFVETKEGNIAVSTSHVITIIFNDGRVKNYSDIQIFGRQVFPNLEQTYQVELFASAKYFDSIYVYNTVLDSFVFFKAVSPENMSIWYDPHLFVIDSDSAFRVNSTIPAKTGELGVEFNGPKATWFNTNDGAWAIDTINIKWGLHFLPGKSVTHTITDNENNIWFSTLGEGVYKLPSQAIQTINFAGSPTIDNAQVYTIDEIRGDIICGLRFSLAVILHDNKITKVLNYKNIRNLSANVSHENRLYSIKILSTGQAIFGFDSYILTNRGNQLVYNLIYPVKCIAEIDSENIIAGTSSFAFKIRVKDLQITDTIWKGGRTTKAFYLDHNYYIGTPNGLSVVSMDKSVNFLGDSIYAFSRKITDIKSAADGTLWVATGDVGVVAYTGKKITAAINSENGLVSDICKCIFLKNNFLWVGTNKGISKIDISKPGFPIINYSTSDGLASNVINAIYVKDSIVYIGTPEGVTYFNENAVKSISRCDLKIQSVTVSGAEQSVQQHYDLKYSENNIRVDFVAISFKSSGDIAYHYKLKGLDNKWHDIRQTFVSYPSLPAGNYSLHIKATNKYGVESKEEVIEFSIARPFWKTDWFFVLLILIAVAITWWVVYRWNYRAKKRLEEKSTREKQIAELEQQALQAQMNPHFIFNCLNSIQQFIVLADIHSANRYLTSFARLVRQTLDNSTKKILTLQEEIDYLELYLELEKMRFGRRFIYSIQTDDTVDKNKDMIPAMIVQPFVENSIRHGLAFKKDDTGILTVSFKKEAGVLICKITDNGIGRRQAAIRRSSTHIEYQSKGMSLTQKRIDLINKTSLVDIGMEVKDLYDEDQPAGTEVTLKISQ